jgi:hypothetical protein
MESVETGKLARTSSDESRFSFVTASSAWLKDAGYADAGWRKQDFQWAEFVLGRLENTAIYLRRLSREEARLTLAWKPGGTFTADGCHYFV